MKKSIIFLLFFLASALLSGCSTDYNYPSKKITVYKTNGVKKDYGLLSVRGDSAVVVLDWSESKVTPLPFSHAEIIKKDSISKIVREGKGAGEAMTTGARVGFIAGAIITLYFTATHPSSSANAFDYLFGPVFGGALFSLPGALVGAIAASISPPTKSFLLISNEDREFLRSIALYPDKEPDEMKYIK